MLDRVRHLPKLRLTPSEFERLPEYSATMPTGSVRGNRWKRLDGSYDPSLVMCGGKPNWMIGEYDSVARATCRGEIISITIRWYRPVIVLPPIMAEA